MTSPLKLLQCPAERPSNAFQHSDASDYISFPDAVSILADRRKAHADNAVLGGYLGNDIGPDGRQSVIEDNEPVIAVFHFADCADQLGLSGLGVWQ